MTEPDSADRFWLNSKEASADAEAKDALATPQPHPSKLPSLEDSQGQCCELEPPEPLELARSPSQEQQQLARIHQLEQALEESQACVSELRLQLSEQHLLETQLASTEEAANLQQRALDQFKQQLFEQQQALENHQSQAVLKDETVQELLATIETLAEAQQGELGRLRRQLAQSRQTSQNSQTLLEQELANRQTALEAQQQRVQELEFQILEARTVIRRLEVQALEQEQQMQALYRRCSDRATVINQLEDQLQEANETLEEQQQLLANLSETEDLVGEQDAAIKALHRQIKDLENQLDKQAKIQARLQQACHDLAESRDRYQAQTSELETHTATLQEQILMQAQQANEYEAAIQYWKDRCNASLRSAQKLKDFLQRVLADSPEDLEELLMAIEPPTVAEIPQPINRTPLSSPQPNKHLQVDLPAFLRKIPPETLE
ncbi:hypothetical protein [Coleofasciculus sp. FACHB-501]|uniref:hypothetical protein n=1 Tax=Cyanophyceae TaxID=3028117 RepID=UPI00168A0947|nr:hypothetical protein [Coleofasciculus sp. FACHB-501]MBD1841552.1 hypothetical protein [Coleofasciculus sp. FACHB-501]